MTPGGLAKNTKTKHELELTRIRIQAASVFDRMIRCQFRSCPLDIAPKLWKKVPARRDGLAVIILLEEHALAQDTMLDFVEA